MFLVPFLRNSIFPGKHHRWNFFLQRGTLIACNFIKTVPSCVFSNVYCEFFHESCFFSSEQSSGLLFLNKHLIVTHQVNIVKMLDLFTECRSRSNWCFYY